MNRIREIEQELFETLDVSGETATEAARTIRAVARLEAAEEKAAQESQKAVDFEVDSLEAKLKGFRVRY